MKKRGECVRTCVTRYHKAISARALCVHIGWSVTYTYQGSVQSCRNKTATENYQLLCLI